MDMPPNTDLSQILEQHNAAAALLEASINRLEEANTRNQTPVTDIINSAVGMITLSVMIIGGLIGGYIGIVRPLDAVVIMSSNNKAAMEEIEKDVKAGRNRQLEYRVKSLEMRIERVEIQLGRLEKRLTYVEIGKLWGEPPRKAENDR